VRRRKSQQFNFSLHVKINRIPFYSIILFQATRSIQKKQQTEHKDKKNSSEIHEKTQNTKKQPGQKASLKINF